MFILNIPEPCHQNWDEMQPETKGRFCGSCQKTVVDFTQLTDEQVKNYLLDNKNKNTCGRFKTSQLGRPFENKMMNINPQWYGQLPFAKQIFYAVAVFFILGASSCDISGNETKTLNQTIQADSSSNKYPTLVGISSLPEDSSKPPIKIQPSVEFDVPKVNMLNHPRPIITAKMEVGEPVLYQDNITQGAPLWVEPIDTNSISTMVGKIAAPIQIDTVAEPVIMGDIAMPIEKQVTEDKKKHAK